MIILKDSEKAINGLAKLIVQEPRLIHELKIIRNALNDAEILAEKAKNKKYFQEQLKIINKAKKIADKRIWYGFEIYDSYNNLWKGFMLYKRINNKMIALAEDFERGSEYNIIIKQNLEEIIKNKNIKNLVTYNPIDYNTLYSQQYEIEEDEDENEPLYYEHQHMEIGENRKVLLEDLLKKKKLKITTLNESQVREFEENLKSVN